jgi:hypothetical protein
MILRMNLNPLNLKDGNKKTRSRVSNPGFLLEVGSGLEPL